MNARCGKCGALIPIESIYCMKCGRRLSETVKDQEKYRLCGFISLILGAIFIGLSIQAALSANNNNWRLWWLLLYSGVISSIAGLILGIYSRVVGKNSFGSLGFYLNLIGYPILIFPTLPL